MGGAVIRSPLIFNIVAVSALILGGCPSGETDGERSRSPSRSSDTPADAIPKHHAERDEVAGPASAEPTVSVPSLRERFNQLEPTVRVQEIEAINSIVTRRDSSRDPLHCALAFLLAGDHLDPQIRAEAQELLVRDIEAARRRLDSEEGYSPFERVRRLAELIAICLALGTERYEGDCERAVVELLEKLDTEEAFVAMQGGLYESARINHCLAVAAELTAAEGDDRLRSHPYFASAPRWFMHHVQPGSDPVLTHGDTSSREAVLRVVASALAALAALDLTPEIQWFLEKNNAASQLGPEHAWVAEALKAVELPEDFSEPPPFGVYPQAAIAFWRSTWEPDADGLLARGAVEGEPNAEQDAGQITWIADGEAVLVEAQRETSVITEDGEEIVVPAHNVLRVGSVGPPNSSPAPIVAQKLSPLGGNLRIDASDRYPELSLWQRDLRWETGGELRINDNVSYALGHRQRTLFFWHLNATEPVEVTEEDSRRILEWNDAALVIQSSAMMELEQFVIDNGGQPQVVILLRTIGAPASFRMLTRVLPREINKEVPTSTKATEEDATGA